MKITSIFFLLAAFGAFAASVSVSAQQRERDPATEQPLYDELKKISPKSVETFKKATEALDGQQYDEAIGLYDQVLQEAPIFEGALRRTAYALAAVGRKEEALASAQAAVDLHRTNDNLVGLASVILQPAPPAVKPSQSEISRAFDLVTEAVEVSKGEDVGALSMQAQLSIELDRLETFRSAVIKMRASFPNEMATVYFSAIDRANNGHFEEALSELNKAESMGLDAETVGSFRAALKQAGDEANPIKKYAAYLYPFLAVTALWALGLLALYVFGQALSSKTLSVIENSDPNDLTGGGHASLKTTYRRLINFAGFYYYVSQPMVVILVVAVTAGIIFAFFMIGRLPIYFLLGLIFVGGGSIVMMFKSLVTRPKVEDPGRVLAVEEAPRLWEMVKQVAHDINTRPIDEIRVTPGVDLAVYERGGFRAKAKDKGERILILGAGVLNGFSANAFRAVLAHEYGHLSGRDTAGGDVAFSVNSHMMRVAEAMINSGTNTYHNLAFHFLRLYHFIFRRITHGASRLQEILADRVAVHTYGAAAFTEGLRHVVRQELVFGKLANEEVSAALAGRRKFNNVYDLHLDKEASGSEIEEAFKTEFERPTSADDSHPAGADRIRLANKITRVPREDLDGMVWDLFVDREEFTAGMNLMLEKAVRGERYSNYHDMGIANAAD